MDQCHRPLCFLSGDFNGATVGWTTFEKELYDVYETFRRLDYILLCAKDIRVFTDHRYLLFVLNSHSTGETLGCHIVLKVLRWELHLSKFNYRIEHVNGSANIAADIMIRWLRGYHRHPRTIKRVRHLLLDLDMVPCVGYDSYS